MKRLALALLLGSCLSASAAPCNIGGTNYGGYCQSAGNYTSISGQMQAPLIAYNGPASTHGASDALTWVGIGSNLATQIQAGIAQQLNSDGSFTYEAWTGAGSITNTGETVLPGDVVTVTITCRTNCTPSAGGQTWDFDLSDVHLDGTTWTFARHGFSSVQDLAWYEVVLEAPVYGASVGYIPNYGILPIKNLLINGSSPTLLSGDGVQMTDPGSHNSNISLPSASGDGFVFCYGENGTFATCGNTPTFARTIAGGTGR